ncbi:MAG: LPS export ABC transporter permease LptF/LPS export ABC transporter permease LptG [Myxococcota bacterium]|jgi:LPS export ABC transporter permease LptF/LPS export ABC transporter permease LptG
MLSLLGLTAVMLTKELLGYSDLVINRGLGADAVLQIAFFQIIPLLTLVFPLAVLMGVLVALGRMGADLEILILETLGMRATRLAEPIGVFALLMALACLGLSLVAAPWASRSLDDALAALSRENPAAQMRAGKINRFGDWRLQAREVSARGDKMKNVLLWMPDLGDTIFAKSGTLTANESGGIDMILNNGRVILDPKEGPRHVEFDHLEAALPDSDKVIERDEDETLKGASMSQLSTEAAAEVSRGQRYPEALVEWHRRLSTPVTALVFGLIAIPLFLTRKEYSRSAGGVWGLATIIAYFGMVQLGDGLIQDQTLSAAMGVWLPNLIITAVGLWLFSTIAQKGVFGRDVDRQRGGSTPKQQKHFKGAIRHALPRYVAGRFLQFTVLSLGVLLAAYLLIDILDRLSWFAKYEATGMEVVRFYGARIPLLASRVVPMSLLVGTALTASHLAVQGELMGMRACGIPAARALMPVLLICLATAPLFYFLNNEIIPRASARQDEIKTNEIKNRVKKPTKTGKREARRERPPVWYRVEGQLFQVGKLDVDRGVAEQIAIYELEKSGLPTRRTFADSARYIGKGNWRLINARNVEWHGDRFYETAPVEFAKLGKELPAKIDTMHFSIQQLTKEIKEVEANDLDASALWVDYYGKLASPFACVVLPAIVLFFAVMGPPFPTSSTTLLLSGALGVGSTLLNGTGASLGYGGAIPPMAAGWGPTLLLAVVALALAARVRAQG